MANHDSIYIGNTPVEEALTRYLAELQLLPRNETVALDAALGRVTSQAVFARWSCPHYHSAAMDGIAVTASATYGASEKVPKTLASGRDYDRVNTGNPLPEGRDAVIMIEEVVTTASDEVTIMAPAVPWQHVRQMGEDLVSGEMVVPTGRILRAYDLGALLSAGIATVPVYSQPRVAIIPSGDELWRFDQTQSDPPPAGRIIESNSLVLAGLVREAGGLPEVSPSVGDDPQLLATAIRRTLPQSDVVLINAGSSAGSKDWTAAAIASLGQVVIHGVAMKPGKPTILGIVEGRPVIGLPGYPVSACLAFLTFVAPVLALLSGHRNDYQRVEAILSQRLVSSLKHQELVRVAMGEVAGQLVATPLSRGAGASMSLIRADGLLTIPRQAEGLESGAKVTVRLLRPLSDIRTKLVCVGSHDPLLDLIADRLPLSSAHVGSLGGLLALRRGECHLAPIHLLDETDGSYNHSWVRRHFNHDMALIRGVQRIQGLMVKPGNPHHITGIADLTQAGLRYLNRQRGAGTRQLLDFHLKKLGIDPSGISGYGHEVTTHLAVALAIKTGSADTGLGIWSAARALGLDFIPIGEENYDFLVQPTDLTDPRLLRLIEILQSSAFQEQLATLGGYTCAHSGQIEAVEVHHDTTIG